MFNRLKIFVVALLVCLLSVATVSLLESKDASSGSEMYDAEVYDGFSHEIRLEQVKKAGRNTIITFFTDWCSPCINELDQLNGELENLSSIYNTDLVAIAIIKKPIKHSIEKMRRKHKWAFEILYDFDEDAKVTFHVNKVPFMMIVNSDNKVIYKNQSYTLDDLKTITFVLEEQAEKDKAKLKLKN